MNKFSKFQADVICELHPLFKGLLFVSAARSTDETRAVLNAIHIEREGLTMHMVATDGRRMHVHTFDPGMFDDDIDRIELGLYDVIVKTSKLVVIAPSECGSRYPDWRGVIPDYEPDRSDSINSRTLSKMGITTGALLAADFAAEACGFGNGRKKDELAHISYGTPSKDQIMVIHHDLGRAYVMPLRMDSDDQGAEEPPKSEADATPDFPDLPEDLGKPSKKAKTKGGGK